MKLDCVFTAVNENKLYLDFIPIFIKTWNKLYPDVDVKIVLIAKDIPEDLIEISQKYRTELVEMAVEQDEKLMEAYFRNTADRQPH